VTAVVPLHPDPSTVPATMSSWQRMMALASAPKTVKCDFCDAPCGIDCTTPTGWPAPFHAARKQAIAHLTDDEQVAAFAAMRAAAVAGAEKFRREEAARMADPDYVAGLQASRQWWNEQIAEVDRKVAAEERDFRDRCTDNPFRGQRSHADSCRCRHTGSVEWTPAVLETRRVEALRGKLPVTDLASVRARRGAA
jgi:hypothetical protein